MEPLGLNWPLLAAQLANIALAAGWLALTLAALRSLRHRALPATATAIWAALILLVPVLGALAFYIARPTRS